MFCCCGRKQVPEDEWEQVYDLAPRNNMLTFLGRLEKGNPYDIMPEWNWLYSTGKVPLSFYELHSITKGWYENPINYDKPKKGLEFLRVLQREQSLVMAGEKTRLL